MSEFISPHSYEGAVVLRQETFGYEQIVSDTLLFQALSRLVQQGLTIYQNNLAKAEEDLRKHLNGAETLILFDTKDQPIAFGIYQSFDYQSFDQCLDISLIVSKTHQGKGLGTQLIQHGLNYVQAEYLMATTQNIATYMAFKKALGLNILSPDLINGEFAVLGGEAYLIAQEALSLKAKTAVLEPNGTIQDYYPSTGLYNRNLNHGSSFPIDSKSSRAVFLLARNPNFKPNI